MKTKRFQLILLGAITLLMSCNGAGEEESENPSDSTIAINDEIESRSNISYSTEDCHMSSYYETRHLLFEGLHEDAEYGAVNIFLNANEKIDTIIEIDTVNSNGDPVLLYEIHIAEDVQANYRRLASWEQTINRTLYGSSNFLSIHLLKDGKVLDRTVYVLNELSPPSLPSSPSSAISLVGTEVIESTCHSFSPSSMAVVCDMTDECTFRSEQITSGNQKIGFFLKDKQSVIFNGGYEKTADEVNYVLLDFSISNNDEASRNTYTVFDISLLKSVYEELDVFVVQYDINEGDKKKKLLTAKTQGQPIELECNQ